MIWRMAVLTSRMTAPDESSRENRVLMLKELARLEQLKNEVQFAGGERYISRHRARGKLLVRERIELLLDPDSPFLELSPYAAWGTSFAVGATLVTGIGVVGGVECMIIANDPTIRGGTGNPFTLRKQLRAMEIAHTNRLPLILLVESGGADLPTQSDLFVPAGAQFREITQMSAARIPVISLVFGTSTAGGAYLPGMSDYTVMVKDRARVFLAGVPLVKMATGEEADEEQLGGADMHSRVSGVSDYLAQDEHDCLRIGREIVGGLNWRKAGPGPSRPAVPPTADGEDLLGLASFNLKLPISAREVIARITDGSRFDEFKDLYGVNLVTGWAHIHGYPVGILANDNGVLFSAESHKAAQFIQLSNQKSVPLVFLQNTTGYMVGTQYEQGGIVKDGAKMINAVANSKVPHLTVIIGGSYGAGNYGMCGRSFSPRFLFTWPNSRTAVMGPAQLAGVMSIVRRQAALRRGEEVDEAADAAARQAVERQIDAESTALFNSGKLYDDGIIDPRDTYDALGMALSACHSAPVEGTDGYGTFRM
jgi:acetyl-CoA carboxylase carboxyltransferase component